MKRGSRRKPGEILGGRYRIDSYLGAGGMGEVYAATQLVTGAKAALKLMFPESVEDPDAFRRFAREARLASAVEHDNVIKIQDVFEDADGMPVMVMELLHGETLAARLRRVGKLSLAEALPIFRCVASALCAAHARGVVHRDLKPDNVFLVSDTVAKVLDFGIAKSLEPELLELQTFGASTRKGSILGSYEYMAMEQARPDPEKKISAAADAWAFAVVFVEALSGRRPLHRDSLPETFVALFSDERVPRVRSLVPELPAALASALDKCLMKKPEQRAADLQEVLRCLTDPVQALRGSRKRGAALSIAAAVALSVAAWYVWHTDADGSLTEHGLAAPAALPKATQEFAHTLTAAEPTTTAGIPEPGAADPQRAPAPTPKPDAPPKAPRGSMSANPNLRVGSRTPAVTRRVLTAKGKASDKTALKPELRRPLGTGDIIEELPD